MKSTFQKPKSQRLLEWFYPETRMTGMTLNDGTVAFYAQVRSLIKPNHTVLDIGCGRGRYDDDLNPYRRKLRSFKGEVARVIGIDIGPAGRDNPHLDEFKMIDGDYWPVAERSVDIALCDYVLEHVENTQLFFAEVNRVLKPGGYFFARTANAWGYVAMISRLIPNRMHSGVVAGAQDCRKAEDVFPTYYRCNTRRALKKQLQQVGLDAVVTTNTSEPSYLGFSSFAYLLGVLHQRLSPKVLNVGLMAFAQKR